MTPKAAWSGEDAVMVDEKKDAPKPLEKEEVHVSVKPKDPKDPAHRQVAEKVKANVEKEVKKALDDNKSGGVQKQLDAAEKKIDDAKNGTSPNQIEKISVKVKGKDGDGDEVSRERSVKPKG